MPLHQTYILESHTNEYVQNFAAFAESNGWILDYNGPYLTNYWRVHLHKGAAHFEMRSTSALAFYVSSCTGYTPGATPANQPGYCGSERNNVTLLGTPYSFASAQGSLYFTKPILTSFEIGSFFTISDKIGNWADGHGFFACCTGCWPENTTAAAGGYAQVFLNGAWTPTVLAGSVGGCAISSDIPKSLPNCFNAGLVFVPILLFYIPTFDSTKRQPLAFAPGIYRANGGDIYQIDDELIIGGDSYVIWPYSSNYVGHSTQGDYVIKLGV